MRDQDFTAPLAFSHFGQISTMGSPIRLAKPHQCQGIGGASRTPSPPAPGRGARDFSNRTAMAQRSAFGLAAFFTLNRHPFKRKCFRLCASPARAGRDIPHWAAYRPQTPCGSTCYKTMRQPRCPRCRAPQNPAVRRPARSASSIWVDW